MKRNKNAPKPKIGDWSLSLWAAVPVLWQLKSSALWWAYSAVSSLGQGGSFTGDHSLWFMHRLINFLHPKKYLSVYSWQVHVYSVWFSQLFLFYHVVVCHGGLLSELSSRLFFRGKLARHCLLLKNNTFDRASFQTLVSQIHQSWLL